MTVESAGTKSAAETAVKSARLPYGVRRGGITIESQCLQGGDPQDLRVLFGPGHRSRTRDLTAVVNIDATQSPLCLFP